MTTFQSINPHNGQVVKSYPGFPTGDLDAALSRGAEAQKEWERTAFEERAELLKRLASGLRAEVTALSELATLEMGKPIGASRAEVEKCAWVCEYYAEHGATHLEDRPVATESRRSYIAFRPIGLVLAVMPWNFPYWQAFRFLAPALMAGNGAVLKHASNVPGCSLAIEKLLGDAGFPASLFQSLLLSSKELNPVIDHSLIRAVTLTGSTSAGMAVAERAGRNLKKTVLELGGSDPYVVLADADPASAAEVCVTSRLLNNGQSCIAAKRFIVHRNVHDAFVEAMVEGMRSKKVGDPALEDNDIGPLARPDLWQQLQQQVSASLELGAHLALGDADLSPGEGNYFRPAVLTGVKPGMPAFDEELFGPVAAIIKADSETEAMQLANQSQFGLGGALFSEDIERAEVLARDQLQVGCCFVNSLVKSDPRLPFGGIKASGYGRELGEFGIREFTNVKTVVVTATSD